MAVKSILSSNRSRWYQASQSLFYFVMSCKIEDKFSDFKLKFSWPKPQFLSSVIYYFYMEFNTSFRIIKIEVLTYIYSCIFHYRFTILLPLRLVVKPPFKECCTLRMQFKVMSHLSNYTPTNWSYFENKYIIRYKDNSTTVAQQDIKNNPHPIFFLWINHQCLIFFKEFENYFLHTYAG